MNWEAPAGCPSAADVSRELERLVRVPPGKAPPHLSVDARVEPRGERWVLHLRTELDGVEGERELEAESCASLARAATLVVALALGVGADAGAAAATPSPTEEPRPRTAARPRVADASPPPSAPAAPPPVLAPAPPPAPLLPAAVVVAPPPPPVARDAWALVVETRVARGPLPGASFGAGIGLDGERGRLLGSLRLETWLPADEDTSAAGVGARFVAVAGELAGCAVAGRARRFSLAGCVGARVGAVRGASTGALFDGMATAPWYVAVPALRTRTRLTRALSLDAGVELAASLKQPRFVIDNLGTVYTVPRLIPTAVVGLALEL